MYKKIIDIQYPNRETEADFPTEVNRAAQFAPFAALAGFEECVREEARTTEREIHPDEGQKEAIDRKIRYIADHIASALKVRVTFFVPDALKDGGKYLTKDIEPVKVKEHEKEIVTSEGESIAIERILSIDIQGLDM